MDRPTRPAPPTQASPGGRRLHGLIAAAMGLRVPFPRHARAFLRIGLAVLALILAAVALIAAEPAAGSPATLPVRARVNAVGAGF